MDIHINYLQEELIHAVQDLDIYGKSYMLSARKNVEFEAKVIQDIVSVLGNTGGTFIGDMGRQGEFRLKYEAWI